MKDEEIKIDEVFMQRCLQLAKLGKGNVAPNPLVGAVLVYNNKIIGEGFHQKYGEAHAEVNCIESVAETDKKYISSSVLYVSLEPCVHFGKTPPCTDLIIKHKIPVVVVGCKDVFTEVDGKGIKKLITGGITVIISKLEKKCWQLNKRFFTFHEKKRPYIILKWAETFNGKIAGTKASERLLISNEFTNRLVHKWRSEETAILIGTNTAMFDNPHLTNRLWSGKSPIRLIIDRNLRLDRSLNIFKGDSQIIVFNYLNNEHDKNVLFYKVEKNENLIQQILKACYGLNIQSILIEGGAALLQSFIDENAWDEIRKIVNEELSINEGVKAPEIRLLKISGTVKILSDRITYFKAE